MGTSQKPSGRMATRVAAFNRFRVGIGAKIILPYLLLTLAVAGVGAFVVTTLVTGSLQERFNNQLLDAGRVVSEVMVRYEAERLTVLRTVAATEGVAESLAAGDREALALLVPQIIANSNSDGVVLLGGDGREIYGWQRIPGQKAGQERAPVDFSHSPEVQLVLNGVFDEFGDKRVFLDETAASLMLYTVGPLFLEDQQVGVVMVGTYLRQMVVNLTETAVARVTLYDQDGRVLETTLGFTADAALLPEGPEQISQIAALLTQSPDRYQVVVARSEDEVPLGRVEVLGQEYLLAFGDWRLRGQSFGLFSVALPGNFIVNAAATSRRLLSLVFSLATVSVIVIGFIVAQRIVRPLNLLVRTSLAVAQGDLGRRSGIQSRDEIGHLAQSFDLMTSRLAERNRQLVEQASKLEAILHSIADGVIVLDTDDRVITLNPAAERVLADMSGGFVAGSLKSLAPVDTAVEEYPPQLSPSIKNSLLLESHRYRIGSRVLSALSAPVHTPEDEVLGTVIVLRDITREVEAEELKDGFITSISHELRTPLTSIIGYTNLLKMSAGNSLGLDNIKHLRRISDSADQLNRSINELINISQIQAGSLGLKLELASMSQLLRELAEKWRKQMAEKGLSLQLQVAEEGMWVNGDRDYLAWAIDNLLRNAHNYTLNKGVIEVHLHRVNGEVRLEVKDRGIGIARADLPHLFDRFFRANNEMAYGVRGVGLGLYITKSIIELHDGRVWVESELGKGSQFTVALPEVKSN